MHPVSTPYPISYRRLWWLAPLSGLAAAVLNAVVFLIARTMGALPSSVLLPNLNEPLSLRLVVLNSLLPALMAGPLLALLGRWSRQPVLVFRLIATAVFFLSLLTPLGIPGAPLQMVLVLELMHGVAAVAITALLTGPGQTQRAAPAS